MRTFALILVGSQQMMPGMVRDFHIPWELALSLLGILLALPPVIATFLIPWFRRNLTMYVDYTKEIGSDILAFSEIQKGVSRLYHQIEREKFDVIVSIDRGGAIIGGYLAKLTGIPLLYLRRAGIGHEFVACFGADDVKAKKVLLVDDAYRSGSTMRRALALVQKAEPQHIKTMALLTTVRDYKNHVANLPVDHYAYFTNIVTLKLPWDIK